MVRCPALVSRRGAAGGRRLPGGKQKGLAPLRAPIKALAVGRIVRLAHATVFKTIREHAQALREGSFSYTWSDAKPRARRSLP